MKRIKAEIMPIPAMSKEDVERFMDWVWKMRDLNMFQPEIIDYPRTAMCKAEAEGEALLFVPLQAVLMYDAIAPKPGLTPRQEALSLWRIGEVVDRAAEEADFKEIYFFCRDDRVADICSQHGFTEIENVRVLKRKVAAKEDEANRTK